MKALIHEGKVIQVVADADVFETHKDMQFVTAPANVQVGWDYDGTNVAAHVLTTTEQEYDDNRKKEETEFNSASSDNDDSIDGLSRRILYIERRLGIKKQASK